MRIDNFHKIRFQGASLGRQLLRTAAHGQLSLDAAIIRPSKVQDKFLESRLAMRILMARLLRLPLFACDNEGASQSAGDAPDAACGYLRGHEPMMYETTSKTPSIERVKRAKARGERSETTSRSCSSVLTTTEVKTFQSQLEEDRFTSEGAPAKACDPQWAICPSGCDNCLVIDSPANWS